MKKFQFLVYSTLFFLLGCTRDNSIDNTPVTYTTQQSQQFITDFSMNTVNCIRNVRDGNAAQAFIDFLNLSNGNVQNESWIDSLTNALDPVIGNIQIDPNINRFLFNNYTGIYTYNSFTKTFSRAPSNGIHILFPSSPSRTNNNVSIDLNNYVDASYLANAETVWLPTSVNGKITKDGTDLVTLNYSANYASGNFPAPIDVTLNLLVAPFSYNVHIERLSNVQFKLTSGLITGNSCDLNITSTVTFRNDDFNNLNIEEDLGFVEATFQKGDFNINATWDARTYFALNSTSDQAINSTFNASVYNNNSRLGDLKFKDIGTDTYLYIYYPDGTNENTSRFYDPSLVDIKNVFRPYFGNDVDSWF